ncbi:6383_t:CDS:1, partial [Dentiscutata heterogama]
LQLNLEEFPKLNPLFSEEEIEFFIKQLKNKTFIFNNKLSTNEATVCEYISIFMTMVVQHIQKYKDLTMELNVESKLIDLEVT